MIEKPADSFDFGTNFRKQNHQGSGFTSTGRHIIMDDIRVRTTAEAIAPDTMDLSELDTITQERPARPIGSTRMFFSETGLIDVPMFRLEDIGAGETIVGPGIVIDNTQTIVITPNAKATVLSSMLVIDVESLSVTNSDAVVEPNKLSVFANRFMGIAEQMGRVLQKTSVDTPLHC
jgi:5-oxoprolinase (ATP-hydrolysing)